MDTKSFAVLTHIVSVNWSASLRSRTPSFTHTRSVYRDLSMYWDAKLVYPLSDYRIYVEIEDGRSGIFDLKPYLDLGVFRELREVGYFNQVRIVLGAVTWPNDQDIAPETLIDEMHAVALAAPPKQVK
jgi:Protein of unknown function (DUF2442)